VNKKTLSSVADLGPKKDLRVVQEKPSSVCNPIKVIQSLKISLKFLEGVLPKIFIGMQDLSLQSAK
jgi:hypothetical protein